MRGFFEIGVYCPKNKHNIGTLWRSAHVFGASGIFVIGARYKRQPSDVMKTWRSIPLRCFGTFDAFLESLPMDTKLVGVEMGFPSLTKKKHPERAVYLLGSEDNGLPMSVLARCHEKTTIPTSIDWQSLNVAVAGSIVMYDRHARTKGET